MGVFDKLRAKETGPRAEHRAAAGGDAVCPVCKMTVDSRTAPARTEHGGQTVYFCASACQKAFDRNPGRFLPARS